MKIFPRDQLDDMKDPALATRLLKPCRMVSFKPELRLKTQSQINHRMCQKSQAYNKWRRRTRHQLNCCANDDDAYRDREYSCLSLAPRKSAPGQRALEPTNADRLRRRTSILLAGHQWQHHFARINSGERVARSGFAPVRATLRTRPVFYAIARFAT